jgi:hypothetical protein
LLRRIPEAAADVEDPVAWARRMQPHRRIAVPLEADHDEIAKLDEAVEKNAAPGLGGLFVLGGNAYRRTLLHGAMVRRPTLLLHIRRDPDVHRRRGCRSPCERSG